MFVVIFLLRVLLQMNFIQAPCLEARLGIFLTSGLKWVPSQDLVPLQAVKPYHEFPFYQAHCTMKWNVKMSRVLRKHPIVFYHLLLKMSPVRSFACHSKTEVKPKALLWHITIYQKKVTVAITCVLWSLIPGHRQCAVEWDPQKHTHMRMRLRVPCYIWTQSQASWVEWHIYNLYLRLHCGRRPLITLKRFKTWAIHPEFCLHKIIWELFKNTPRESPPDVMLPQEY